MKFTITILLYTFFSLYINLALTQPPPCGENDEPADLCTVATPICNLDGYCGSTSSNYSVTSWNSSCGFLGLFNCGLGSVFCGSIENNSFLSFVASETSISFDVWVYNSLYDYGIQIMIFSSTGNCSGNVTSLYCNNQMEPSPHPQTVSANGLTIGNTYYIMIDGFAGDVCDYTFSANSGVATPLNVSTGSTATVCVGETLTVTASGGDGNYVWDASPHLNTTTGATVEITPTNTGVFTYNVTAGSGTPLCPSSNSFSLTVTVDDCDCEIVATISDSIFCSDEIGSFNLYAISPNGSNFSWTGPNGYISNTQNPTNVPIPQDPGNYSYTVTATEFGQTCSSTVNLLVNNRVVANAGNGTTLNCYNPSVTLQGSSTGTDLIYNWTGPSITSNGNTLFPTIDAPGTYTLTVTDTSTNCFAQSVVNVLQDIGGFTIDAGEDKILDCNITSVQLNGSSTETNVQYVWVGTGILSGQNSPNPTVNQPGAYTLFVTNLNNGCVDSADVSVIQNVLPPNSNFIQDTLIGCVGLSVHFTAVQPLPNHTFEWNFGNGITANGITSSYTYNHAGCFQASLTVTDLTNGCKNTTYHSDSICVYVYPEAYFQANPLNILPFSGETHVNLSNYSINSNNQQWFFPDGSQSNTIHSSFDFENFDPGNYSIYLIASNNNICYDTFFVNIILENEVIYYVPNTFTPDNDEYNQFFKPIISSGIDIYKFTFQIYNRWGEMIWESHDPNVGWDGKYNGSTVPDGTYTWVMHLKTIEKDYKILEKGLVNVLR